VDGVTAALALRLLRERGALARAIVFGSFGLALHGRRTFDDVPDLDVVASLDDTIDIARALIAAGARVTSWKDPVTRDVERERLRGRIYLRAHIDALTIDVTYEGVDVDAFRSDAHVIDGVHVASLSRIEERRAAKAADAARLH
jgi:hypothetical protein